jgi:hypothetical protein
MPNKIACSVFGLPRMPFGWLNRLSTLSYLEARFNDVSANVTIIVFKVKEYGAQNNQKLRAVTCTRGSLFGCHMEAV